MNLLIQLAVLIPVVLIGISFIIPVLKNYKFKYLCEIFIVISLYNFILSVYIMFKVITDGPITYNFGGWAPPWGIEFYIGSLEAVMIFLVTSIYLLILIYAFPIIRKELSSNVYHWYYVLLILLKSFMIGMIVTNDLFNFFVFMEIGAIASVAVISVRNKRESIEASLKYLFLSNIGSAFVLFAIGLLYMITGHLNFQFVGEALKESAEIFPQTVNLSLLFIFLGLALKAALFPLHIWLPDAYTSAPTASTVILAGLVGKVYIIGLIKILFKVYSIEILEETGILPIILFLSGLAIIMGSIFAIGQNSIKRILAYSSVAQIGYIFLGIGLASENSLHGGMLHIINHAVIKSLLFMTIGIIIFKTGKEKISDLKGIGRQYPFTMIIFSIAALSMIGIPPLNGFISKWLLAMGTLEAEQPVYLVIILASSLLNSVYYFPIIINSFFGGTDTEYNWKLSLLEKKVRLPLIILTLIILGFGLYPDLPLYFIRKATVILLASG
ncbi:MAG: complex I subunit 5 family protein [Halanaerobiales bacterium]